MGVTQAKISGTVWTHEGAPDRMRSNTNESPGQGTRPSQVRRQGR
jgi:hypothetical protein